MSTGIVLLNFGEPSTPDRDVVVEYLTRIFLANADLESADDPTERARELAERRAPGLIEEYEAIDGSPLNQQASEQATALQSTLDARGYDVIVYSSYQFIEPLIESTVTDIEADGVDRVIGLPVYPLCGPSTTVAALDRLTDAIDSIADWSPDVNAITGWHRHPTYNHLRADVIRSHVAETGLDITSDAVQLVFSAHGTPLSYVESGSRYVEYVEEYCRVISAMVGVDDYALGYQNHENRDIPWTEPTIETVVDDLQDTAHIVVDAISFMHEQSETLSELDIDLRDDAVRNGVEYHRVPIPYDDPRFTTMLADLVEPFVLEFDSKYYRFGRCTCRDRPDSFCLNSTAPR